MDNWNNKQKVIVQIVCIMLSIGLWFYVTNIENPIKTYDINKVPVELLNVDSLNVSGLTLSPNQQFYVNLTIEGQSQDVFRVDKSDFKITVDLSEFAFVKGAQKIPVTIKEVPENIRVKNSNGLTVTVSIENYISKEVPVKSRIEVISKSNYYVSTPTFVPEVVNVSGPESLVNKVDKVIAEGQESNAIETIVKNYMVSPVDEDDNLVDGVELSEQWVEAKILINQGKSVPIKVNTTGELPNGLILKSIEPSIKEVGITGSQDVLDTVGEIGTEVVDLSQITDSTTLNLALGVPDNILIDSGEYSVSVNIVVEKVQQVQTKEFTIGYSLINAPAGFIITTNVDKVTFKVSGYEEELKAITEANFTATLDLSKYTEEGTFTDEPVVVLSNPIDGINISDISKVELNIVKEVPETGGETEQPQ